MNLSDFPLLPAARFLAFCLAVPASPGLSVPVYSQNPTATADVF